MKRLWCRLRGHTWRLVSLTLKDLIGTQDNTVVIEWQCTRCGRERVDVLSGAHVRVKIVPGEG